MLGFLKKINIAPYFVEIDHSYTQKLKINLKVVTWTIGSVFTLSVMLILYFGDNPEKKSPSSRQGTSPREESSSSQPGREPPSPFYEERLSQKVSPPPRQPASQTGAKLGDQDYKPDNKGDK